MQCAHRRQWFDDGPRLVEHRGPGRSGPSGPGHPGRGRVRVRGDHRQGAGLGPDHRPRRLRHGAASGRDGREWRWTKGTPTASTTTPSTTWVDDDNADGHALYAVTSSTPHDVERGEHGMIIVRVQRPPSPVQPRQWRWPEQALIDAVAHARKAGFDVIAVAIDGSDQSTYYGAEHVVPFAVDRTRLGSSTASVPRWRPSDDPRRGYEAFFGEGYARHRRRDAVVRRSPS